MDKTTISPQIKKKSLFLALFLESVKPKYSLAGFLTCFILGILPISAETVDILSQELFRSSQQRVCFGFSPNSLLKLFTVHQCYKDTNLSSNFQEYFFIIQGL